MDFITTGWLHFGIFGVSFGFFNFLQSRNNMNGNAMMKKFISEACTGGGRGSRSGKTKTSFLRMAVGFDWQRRNPVEPRVIGFQKGSKGMELVG